MRGVSSLARKRLPFHIFHFHFFREVSPSHESFVFTSSTFRFSGRSRTKATFSHLQLSEFEGGLARKLRFHIFHFHFFREVLHESFVFTSSTFRFLGTSQVSHESFVFTASTFRFSGRSRTKASFSHLQLSDFQGGLKSRTKATFSHLQLSEFEEVSHESFVLPLADFEGGLSRKLRFHIFNCRRDLLLELQFYCALQLSVCRSHCSGCVKVAGRRGCMRKTILFCSWAS